MTQPQDNPISPNHYARYKIQPLDFINANELGFSVGNVIKYVCRYTAKDGLQDLEKARSYLDRLIAAEKGKEKAPVPPTTPVLYCGYEGPIHPQSGWCWSVLMQAYVPPLAVGPSATPPPPAHRTRTVPMPHC